MYCNGYVLYPSLIENPNIKHKLHQVSYIVGKKIVKICFIP
jgi:hypothetical protein